MGEEPTTDKSTEIFSKTDIFFVPQKPPPNSPQKTSNSPRFHHKKPSKKRTNTRNPPVKMRQSPRPKHSRTTPD
jgi:hypothetical protein